MRSPAFRFACNTQTHTAYQVLPERVAKRLCFRDVNAPEKRFADCDCHCARRESRFRFALADWTGLANQTQRPGREQDCPLIRRQSLFQILRYKKVQALRRSILPLPDESVFL